MRIYVIAGSYGQFLGWCREVNVNPRGPEVHYVRDEWTLRGVDGGLLLVLSGADQRSDTSEIVAMARYRRLKVVMEP